MLSVTALYALCFSTAVSIHFRSLKNLKNYLDKDNLHFLLSNLFNKC